MAQRKPLVVGPQGWPEQLQSGDTLPFPTGFEGTVRLVTNVCLADPVYWGGAGIVVQYTYFDTVTWQPGAVECVFNPTDCCAGISPLPMVAGVGYETGIFGVNNPSGSVGYETGIGGYLNLCTVVSAGCPDNTLPATIYLSIANVENCSCMDNTYRSAGPYALSWNGSNWSGSFTSCGGMQSFTVLYIAGNYFLGINYISGGVGYDQPMLALQRCSDPFTLTAENASLFVTCNEEGGVVNISISGSCGGQGTPINGGIGYETGISGEQPVTGFGYETGIGLQSGVNTDCCPDNTLPSTIYLTLSGTGDCSCTAGTYAMFYNPTPLSWQAGDPGWYTEPIEMCGGSWIVGFICKYDIGLFTIDFYRDLVIQFGGVGILSSCNPFYWNGNVDGQTLCSGIIDYTIIQ